MEEPYTGHFQGGEHIFAVRVYFEDTDFSGVVYHANYLRFFERARSDMLRAAGIDQAAAHGAGTGTYAVATVDLKFRRPAHFDDALVIHSRTTAIRGASVDIRQLAKRGDEVLCEANVTAAFLSPAGRPKRQPKDWIAIYERLRDAPDSQKDSH